MQPHHSETNHLITRSTDGHWIAMSGDRQIGRGDALPRPDGRIFVSIDTWDDAVFHPLADAMLAELPRPLHTIVDTSDADLRSHWERAGLRVRRHEWLWTVPTDQPATAPPAGVTLLPVGAAHLGPLRELYTTIRAEVDASVGWHTMPVEMPPRPGGAPLDAAAYAVAVESGEYVGLARVNARRRHARIGLLAVRADARRRGIGRALLVDVLGALHHSGLDAASADVDESNTAATALVESLDGRRAGGVVELVLR